VKVLLDTNILAELVKPVGHPGVRSALAELPASHLYLSVLTVGEIVKGITLLEAGQKKRHLAGWLVKLEGQYAERILPIDAEVARIWGEVTAKSQRIGMATPTADGLMAATALRHGLHVMTRNTKHFEASGVLIIDPWQDS
jgi:predicted nucleic acid-binding protein